MRQQRSTLLSRRVWIAALASSSSTSSLVKCAFLVPPNTKYGRFLQQPCQPRRQVRPITSTLRYQQSRQLTTTNTATKIQRELASLPNQQSTADRLIVEEDALQACWNVTSEQINPNYSSRIDKILQRLNSPAPQSYFVLERAIHKAAMHNDTEIAEQMMQVVASFVIKRGHKLVMITKEKDGINAMIYSDDWNIVPLSENCSGTEWREILPNKSEFTTLRMANQILDIVQDASERQVLIPRDQVAKIVTGAMQQLDWTLGVDIRGRTSSDTAFLFALAGITDEGIFRTLVYVSKYEIERLGKRPSFRSKYILQMLEKLAAAGIKGEQSHVRELHQKAAECLRVKNEHLDIAEALASSGHGIGLLSHRPLLWLWRFSARQTKPKDSVSDIATSSGDSSTQFSTSLPSSSRRAMPKFLNLERPLVLDIGCGLGVSLLGLASTPEPGLMSPTGEFCLQSCNFLGGDLSQLAIGYAQGISNRWGLDKVLQYTWASAEETLAMVEDEYKGPVALIMIQFPTPYRLKDGDHYGNSQLPSDQESGFMVSERLLRQVMNVLSKSEGKLLLQSNCEDVAVTVRRTAIERLGMKLLDLPEEVQYICDDQQTLRSLEWARQGGERAIGRGWSAKPLLPPQGITETEASCTLQGTPIHRCLLSIS